MLIRWKMIIKRIVEIDYGHTLPDYVGFCNQLHGHRAKIVAHFEGKVYDNGMLVDFKVCKDYMKSAIVDVLDHGFAVWIGDTEKVKMDVDEDIYDVSTLDFVLARNDRVLECELPPTAEYLAYWAMREINQKIFDEWKGGNVRCVRIEWHETPNNIAECDETSFASMKDVLLNKRKIINDEDSV